MLRRKEVWWVWIIFRKKKKKSRTRFYRKKYPGPVIFYCTLLDGLEGICICTLACIHVVLPCISPG